MEGVLRDGGICTSVGIPGSSQVKHTSSQRIVAQLCANEKKVGLVLRVSSRIVTFLEDLGCKWSCIIEPYQEDI